MAVHEASSARPVTVRLSGCAATPIPDGRALKLARSRRLRGYAAVARFLSGRQNCRFVGLGSPSGYNLTFVQAVTRRAGRVGFVKSPAHLPASRASRARGLFRAHSIMAKRCELCGKGPGRRPQHQPRAQRHAAPVRAEPPARPRAGERRHPAPARLHALPALGQGRQGRLDRDARGGLDVGGPGRDRARTRRRSAPARCSSSRDRSRSIRRPARWSTATSRRRRTASSATSADPRSRRRSLRPRRPHHGLPRGHERLRRDERGLRRPTSRRRRRRARPSRPRGCRRTRASKSTSSPKSD